MKNMPLSQHMLDSLEIARVSPVWCTFLDPNDIALHWLTHLEKTTDTKEATKSHSPPVDDDYISALGRSCRYGLSFFAVGIDERVRRLLHPFLQQTGPQLLGPPSKGEHDFEGATKSRSRRKARSGSLSPKSQAMRKFATATSRLSAMRALRSISDSSRANSRSVVVLDGGDQIPRAQSFRLYCTWDGRDASKSPMLQSARDGLTVLINCAFISGGE